MRQSGAFVLRLVPTKKNPMFRLFSYFSLSSAIAMVMLTTVLVVGYQHHATTGLVTMTERQNVAMARVIANSIWPEYSTYLTTVPLSDGDALRSRPETERIHRQLHEIAKGVPVHKVKYYNMAGVTVYSSEFSQIGEDKSKNSGFRTAISKAIPVSKMSYRDRFSAFSGTLHGIDVVESYVPITDANGNSIGVFELYYDVSSSVATIAEDRWVIAKALIGAFASLYLILLLVVRRAEVILRRQYSKLQNELVQKERLSVLGRLTATVGHEFAQPPRRPSQRDLYHPRASNKSPDLMPHIEAGERSIARCDNIIQDLLEHNRRHRLDCSATDLAQWTKGVLDEQFLPEGIELKFEADQPGPIVEIDDDRFRRVLINLVENSCQALKDTSGDRIVTVAVASESDGARISVTDNGHGITSEDLARIFEPLFTTKSFGSGLGLPTVKRLVKQHGGSMSVTSNLGEGSTFTVVLPHAQASEHREAA